ncbi:hypothetical protein Tco_0304197 [Tanacetum coccineum]
MEEVAVREAGAAGLQSLEHLIGLSYPTTTNTIDYTAVADVAIHKFKKFISLLDRSSTGHARFRRGPISQNQIPIQKKSTLSPVPSPASIPATPPATVVTEKVFAPASIQQRVVKSGSFERKDVPTATINFAGAAAAVSPATSFMSSLSEDEDFNSGAWVSATNYVNANGGTVTGCLGRHQTTCLKREKLEQVVQ